MSNKISYYKRDFVSIKNELIQYIDRNYPETITNFNDASIGMALIEMLAATGDMLSFNVDRVANEVFIGNMKQRYTLFEMARNYGVKIPPKTPAITLCEFSVEVPVAGDTFDLNYAPLLLRGAQVTGGGQTFETLYDIDFSSPYNAQGQANRKVQPLASSNNRITGYRLIKTEMVVAGRTKYFSRIIQPSDSKPFLKFDLPDNDVISIERGVLLDGTDYDRIPTLNEQLNSDNVWYPVDSLIENQIFKPKPLMSSDSEGIVRGQWENILQKFTYNYDVEGRITIQFGNGRDNRNEISSYNPSYSYLIESINNKITRNSLGIIPKSNSTFFIQYRVGGGQTSNVSAGVLNSIGNSASLLITGINPTLNTRVKNSLSVTNILPALGGREALTNEEIRFLIENNFQAQNRCVSLKDYFTRLMQMDGKFGKPFDFSIRSEQGNIVISIVNQDASGNLTNESTTTLKENVRDYLVKYKSPNDFVIVEDARIINIALDFELLVSNLINQNQIVNEVVNRAYNFVKEQSGMGESIYLSKLSQIINEISGVLNLININVINKTSDDGNYSPSIISQSVDSKGLVDTRATMRLNANINEIFEIKNKNKDIRVKLTV